MQSAVRFEVEVGDDRVVHLPGEVPTGRAEIIVLIPAPPLTRCLGVAQLVGLLRTDRTPPDDSEVRRILDEARAERGGG
jgi:hypothetical protein